MTRLFVGHKPGVGGVVKVMRNDGDDPLLTSNYDYGKFLFNSETGKVGYVDYFQTFQFDHIPENSVAYYPAGTNMSNCHRFTRRGTTLQNQYVFPGRILGLGDISIVYEFREKKALGEVTVGPYVQYSGSNKDGVVTLGRNSSLGPYRMFAVNRVADNHQGYDFPKCLAGYVAGTFQGMDSISYTTDDQQPMLCTIMNLPADSTPMPTTPVGAAGSRNTILVPSLVRIAKAGASADGPSDGIIVDSTKVPMKIVRAGEVNVPASSSVDLMSPVPLNENSFMDWMCWETGGSAFVPQAATTVQGYVNDHRLKMDYTIYGDRVRVFNNGPVGITVRYMICHDDGLTQTGGGSQVFRRLADGNIQIKRPGSSDVAPSSKDILLDTRYAYLPIVAEGFVNHTQFAPDSSQPRIGTHSLTLNFSNDGSYRPFLKYYVMRNNGGVITAPEFRMLRSNPVSWAEGYPSSRSSCALVTNTSVKFWMSRNNADEAGWNGSEVTEVHNDYLRVYGYRYYVFAIPTSL